MWCQFSEQLQQLMLVPLPLQFIYYYYVSLLDCGYLKHILIYGTTLNCKILWDDAITEA